MGVREGEGGGGKAREKEGEEREEFPRVLRPRARSLSLSLSLTCFFPLSRPPAHIVFHFRVTWMCVGYSLRLCYPSFFLPFLLTPPCPPPQPGKERDLYSFGFFSSFYVSAANNIFKKNIQIKFPRLRYSPLLVHTTHTHTHTPLSPPIPRALILIPAFFSFFSRTTQSKKKYKNPNKTKNKEQTSKNKIK